MEENKNGMSLLVECEDCKTRFEVGSTIGSKVLINQNNFDVNGRSIFLKYYDCPECGRKHFVQIDDAKSLQEFVKVKNQFVEFAIAKRKGKKISKKQSDKFKKARQYLAEYRMNLMKEFTGKSVIDENGNEYILRFSI